MNKIFALCSGRHTFFAAAFSAFGSGLAWYHKLDGTYVSFVTVMMGFVLGHSYKEDVMTRRDNAVQDSRE